MQTSSLALREHRAIEKKPAGHIMAPPSNADKTSQDDISDVDLAQALKDLQRGEKTAQMLETSLTSLEKKIDDLLASFEDEEPNRIRADKARDDPKKDNGDSEQS
ncbi:hypothetical protein ACMFMG_006995 [Clarireedia jacksonii]